MDDLEAVLAVLKSVLDVFPNATDLTLPAMKILTGLSKAAEVGALSRHWRQSHDVFRALALFDPGQASPLFLDGRVPRQ